ncbi:recombinase family protein [Lysinibacillus sp. RC79]|uniref:recombinase family protein n=1 Tax=Lysinibacillus sp. RC79 TaxID=3156296 RepID=UPI003513E970
MFNYSVPLAQEEIALIEQSPSIVVEQQKGKEKKFDVILVKELSRLARNGALSYDLREVFEKQNIHLVCLDNSINTLEKNDLNYGLFAWLYEAESINNSRRNKQTKRIKAQQGLYVGSYPPYGYKSEKGKLLIRDDETPEIVRRIFKEYLEGKEWIRLRKIYLMSIFQLLLK